MEIDQNENKYHFIKWTDKILIKENVSSEKSRKKVLNWNTMYFLRLSNINWC
jgi:hypothetical protein